MKRTLIVILTFVALASPLAAFASTVELSPAVVSVSPGQTFSVSIVVNAQETDYTAKAVLSYPAELLSVSGFSFAPGWLALSQPGYDSIDNANGTLVKTAGFSGGFSGTKVLGTVTFVAKAAGQASISVSASTQILDANNANTFTSGGRASVEISKPASVPTIPVSASKPAPVNTANPARNPLSTTKKTAAAAGATSTATTTEAVVPTGDTSSSTEKALEAPVAGSRTKEVPLSLSALAVLASFFLGIIIGRQNNLA